MEWRGMRSNFHWWTKERVWRVDKKSGQRVLTTRLKSQSWVSLTGCALCKGTVSTMCDGKSINGDKVPSPPQAYLGPSLILLVLGQHGDEVEKK